MYVVISTGLDGTSIERLDEETLRKKINEHYWGPMDDVLGSFPTDTDPNCWGEGFLILKCEGIVQPTPVETVKSWEIGSPKKVT